MENMKNKIEIKNLITDYVNKITYNPSSLDDIQSALNINDNDLFILATNELIEECEVFWNKKNDKIISSRMAQRYKGIISIRNADYGFISNKFYPDFYCNSVDFLGAMNNDEVLYKVVDDYGYGKSDQAIVLKVLKRYYQYLVGEVFFKNGKYFLNSTEKYLNKTILISNPKKAKSKDIVRTKILSYGETLKVEVIDILGDNDTIGIDILEVLAEYGICKEFSEEVKKEAKELQKPMVDELKRRVDFSSKKIFTIDGADALDLDDAVSIEKLDNGNYLLGVYIADVSYYVTENSAIDLEAVNRGTSIYLTDRVVPMLPFELSNDLCSLNPSEEKLVIACLMEVDNNGEVVDRRLVEGFIKTVKRLSYEKCNDVLNNGLVNNPDYEVVYDSLKEMKKLSLILIDKLHRRGSIDFDLNEVKVIVDEKGKAIGLEKIVRGVSERIIEQFMILANETVAEYITDMDLPFIYRIHDKPDNLKFQNLKSLVNGIGYKLNSVHPKEIQKLLELIDSDNDYLKNSVLRLMAKAVYSAENIGHFGLASKCYTHFTSPIRRYPDLIVHRLIRKYIFNKDNNLNMDESITLVNKIAGLAKSSSDCERIANEIEFKVIDMKKAEYMANFVGEIYDGIITSVLKFGMFVALDNSVEGLVNTRFLHQLNFEYNDYSKCYINTLNKKRLGIGDKVKVKLIKSDKKTGAIDFDLVYNNIGGIKRYGKNVKNKNYRKK